MSETKSIESETPAAVAGAARGSAAEICDNCMNWEDPAASKLMGMKRTPNHGYCVLFQKQTTRHHGEQCTAFAMWPSDQDKMNDLAASEAQPPNDES